MERLLVKVQLQAQGTPGLMGSRQEAEAWHHVARPETLKGGQGQMVPLVKVKPVAIPAFWKCQYPGKTTKDSSRVGWRSLSL